MDRASGSGVFARDPDALIDMIELEVTDAVIKEETDREVIPLCCQYLDRSVQHWKDSVSQDDLCSASVMLKYCAERLAAPVYDQLMEDCDRAEQRVRSRTAWRVEGTLREFPKFQPVHIWFDYPVHRIDDRGILADLESEGQQPPWKRAVSKHKKSAADKKESDREKFEEAVANSNMGEPPTVQDLVDWYTKDGKAPSEKSVRRWAQKFGFCVDKNFGTVVRQEDLKRTET